MKKYVYLLLVCICLTGMLTSCNRTLEVDSDTVYVKKRGDIIGISVEKLDKDYYSEEELEEYVKERVDTFTAGHEKNSVKEDKFSVNKEIVKLQLKYKGYEEYAAFNEVIFFEGMVAEALAAGYDFDIDFSAVINANKEKGAKVEDITGNSDHKVVILNQVTDVKVDGEIAFVSSDNTKITGKDTVSVQLPKEDVLAEDTATPLTYIIYK